MGCDSGNLIHLRKYDYKKRLWYKNIIKNMRLDRTADSIHCTLNIGTFLPCRESRYGNSKQFPLLFIFNWLCLHFPQLIPFQLSLPPKINAECICNIHSWYFPHVLLHRVLPESRSGAQKPTQNTKICFASAMLLTIHHLGYKSYCAIGNIGMDLLMLDLSWEITCPAALPRVLMQISPAVMPT